MKAEELVQKLIGYMIAEINYDVKNGKYTTDEQLSERFRDDYKAWKQMFSESNKFITLYASEVEKIIPAMKGKWR